MNLTAQNVLNYRRRSNGRAEWSGRRVSWRYWRNQKTVIECDSWAEALGVAYRIYRLEVLAGIPDRIYEELSNSFVEECPNFRNLLGHLGLGRNVL